MEKEKIYKNASEYGVLHNEDCCTNFPEDNRACDVGTGILDCCENMKMVKSIIDETVTNVVETLSYDMEFKDEERYETISRHDCKYLSHVRNKVN